MGTIVEIKDEVLCQCGRVLGVVVDGALKVTRKGMEVLVHEGRASVTCPQCKRRKTVRVS